MIKEERVGSNTILWNVPKPITKAKLIEFLKDCPDDSEIFVRVEFDTRQKTTPVEGNSPWFYAHQLNLMQLVGERSKKGTTIQLIGWAKGDKEVQDEL